MATALAEKWDRENPEGAKERWTLCNAIRAGKIKRGPCVDCGSTRNVFGIHPDYSRPLDVVWRCALCHHRGRFAVPPGTQLIVIDTFNSHKESRA